MLVLQALRESFITLYEMPVLENLLDSLQHRYPNIKFPDVPTRGNFDVKNVQNSTYFFH